MLRFPFLPDAIPSTSSLGVLNRLATGLLFLSRFVNVRLSPPDDIDDAFWLWLMSWRSVRMCTVDDGPGVLLELAGNSPSSTVSAYSRSCSSNSRFTGMSSAGSVLTHVFGVPPRSTGLRVGAAAGLENAYANADCGDSTKCGFT